MTWAEAVRRANEAIDWIEARQGPLKPDGYARIETTVSQVRALREAGMADDEWISEIRARLAAATPGPWVDCESDGVTWVDGVGPCGLLVCNTGVVANRYSVANTRFIAHAPADIAHLLARVDALEAKRDQFENLAERMGALNGELLAERDALTAERDNARGAFSDLLDSHCHWETAAQAAQAERDALRARAERAEAALAPIIEAYTSADYCGWCQRLLSECTATCAARKARAALAAAGEGTDS